MCIYISLYLSFFSSLNFQSIRMNDTEKRIETLSLSTIRRRCSCALNSFDNMYSAAFILFPCSSDVFLLFCLGSSLLSFFCTTYSDQPRATVPHSSTFQQEVYPTYWKREQVRVEDPVMVAKWVIANNQPPPPPPPNAPPPPPNSTPPPPPPDLSNPDVIIQLANKTGYSMAIQSSHLPLPTWFHSQEEVVKQASARGLLVVPGEHMDQSSFEDRVWLDPQVNFPSLSQRAYWTIQTPNSEYDAKEEEDARRAAKLQEIEYEK